jgi:hypothetical protein
MLSRWETDSSLLPESSEWTREKRLSGDCDVARWEDVLPFELKKLAIADLRERFEPLILGS